MSFWLGFLASLVSLSFIFMGDICRGSCQGARHRGTEGSSDFLRLLQLVTVVVLTLIPTTVTQGVYRGNRILLLLLLLLGHNLIE